jgi:hypothetical protein
MSDRSIPVRKLASFAVAIAALALATLDARALTPDQTGPGGEAPLRVFGHPRTSVLGHVYLSTHQLTPPPSIHINQSAVNQAVHAPAPHHR